MKRLKPEKKRLVASIVAVILIAAMVLSIVIPFIVPVFGAEFNESDITVEAVVGFDGNIKVMSENMVNGTTTHTEIRIKIKNNSNEIFKGSINIPIRISENYYENLKSEIELNPKIEKNVILTTQINCIQKEYEIIIKDIKDNTVTKENINTKSFNFESIWIGFLSNSPSSLTYLKPGFISDNNLFINLDENNFPDSKNVLNNFNLLFLNEFELEYLNDSQRSALKEWIAGGGVLICGSSFKNEMQNNYTSIKENRTFLDEVKLLSETFNEYDNEIIDKIFVYQYGNGKIYFNDFSLAENENSLNSTILRYELDMSYNDCIYTTVTDTNSFLNNLTYYNDRMPIFKDILIKIIFIVILGYLIFIGFILYFILKKKDKLNKALFILPVSALSLTVLIYICSFSTVYKRPIINIITYINNNNSVTDTLNTISAVSVFSHDKGNININIPNEFSVLKIKSDYGYGYDETESEVKNFVLERGFSDKNYLTLFDKEKWSRISFNISGKIENKGKIDMDLKIVDNQFIGQVTNNTGYDLYDVIMGYNEYYFVVHEFKNGETINVGEGDYICLLNTSSSNYYYDILTNGSRNNRNEDEERLYELELRQDIFNGLKGNESDIGDIVFKVVGFNNESIINDEFITNNKLPENYNTNVFYEEKKIDINDFTEGIIPNGFITPVLENDNGYFEANSNTIYFYDYDLPTILSFKIPDTTKISGFNLVLDDYECDNYIYNQNLNVWEKATSHYTQNFDDYINENNKILIEVQAYGKDSISIPQISLLVEGGEEDA